MISLLYNDARKAEEYHKSIKNNTAFPKIPAKSYNIAITFYCICFGLCKSGKIKAKNSANHFALKIADDY